MEAQEKGDQSRVALKAEAARKKKASKMKKARRKYRDLEKDAEEGEIEELEVDDADLDGNTSSQMAENGPSEKSSSSSTAGIDK